VIAVDASALVAIGDEEPEADLFLDALSHEDGRLAAVNYVETGLILIGRGRFQNPEGLDTWLARLGVEVVSDAVLSAAALRAYQNWGRRYHRARLNLADCFAYALAKSLNVPLLYKGNDFAMTDIRSALG
jgi:ribonuclease VapC